MAKPSANADRSPGVPAPVQGKDRREVLPYIQYIGYTDRLDYLSAMNNNQAWSTAVEKLAGIEIPPRAEYIRVLAAELNRIASHLVSFGTYGLDMGAFTPFLVRLPRPRIRPRSVRACSAAPGSPSATSTSAASPGTCRPGSPTGCSNSCDYFGPKIDEYDRLLERQSHLRQANRQHRRRHPRHGDRSHPDRPDDPRQRDPVRPAARPALFDLRQARF